MSTRSETRPKDRFVTVEVHDPDGQRSVLLEGLRMSATVEEIRGRAMSELRLPPDVDWNVRHTSSGRLLQEEQRVRDFAGESAPHVEVTMQPDAGLG